MTPILENNLIDRLVSRFRRSPIQSNGLHEADAELIRVSNDLTLALTTDTIAEEIAVGLYADPWLIGWMTAMVNLSDLAAVGAEPIGLLVSEILPQACGDEFLDELQRGIEDACSACGTFILGGDTNRGENLVLTGTAVGRCPHDAFLSRRGCTAGDRLYATGSLGGGNAFALSVLLLAAQQTAHGNVAQLDYRPTARLVEGRSLVGLATSCMDTSDGVLATLDQMSRLNGVGFELDSHWEGTLDPRAKDVAAAAGIPPWLLLAGQHGEFELLFTVPQDSEDDLRRVAAKCGWAPVPLGRVIEMTGVVLPLYGEVRKIDTARIRNCSADAGNDVGNYLRQLLAIEHDIRKGVLHHAND